MDWILRGFELAVGASGAYLLFRSVRMLIRLPGQLRSERERRRKIAAVNDLMQKTFSPNRPVTCSVPEAKAEKETQWS